MINSIDWDKPPRHGSDKFIYSNNMTLGLAIGSKSNWKDESQSPRLLRKPQSAADRLEKVLPTIPPWVLVDSIGINQPPTSSSHSSPISPSSPSPSPIVTTPWTPQKSAVSLSSQSPSSTHSRSASSSCEHLHKLVDVVRNRARSTKRLPPKMQSAFRSFSGKTVMPAEPEFEIITPGSSWKTGSAESYSDLTKRVASGVYLEAMDVMKEERREDEEWDDSDSTSSESSAESDLEMEPNEALSPIRGPIDPYASIPPHIAQRSLPKPDPGANTATVGVPKLVIPKVVPKTVVTEVPLPKKEEPLAVVTTAKKSRPLPSPPVQTHQRLTSVKPRPPMLVLPSPPIRSSSRSPMLTATSMLSASSYRDRDLPAVPVESPSNPGYF
ncbi:hypothetical protein GYMLUDRAFT_580527 [Collybiopsis luxurians FD-317 M1]|uniref:Uncharacterized protein n=1 Tax=Collybiopsis luxurians FD-317 M1 TaxID=944289 RepID=A0A0D0BC87_9AGAR|nr:hypothetical protein GYMLUDRAFT_580527 [Collybiopsis luxurians FD-317 M1]